MFNHIESNNTLELILLLKHETGFSFATIEKAAENGFWDIVEIMLEKNNKQSKTKIKGEMVDITIFKSDEEGIESLALALKYGQWELAKKLFVICEHVSPYWFSKFNPCLYFILDKMLTVNSAEFDIVMELFDKTLVRSNTIQPVMINNPITDTCMQLAIRKKMDVSIINMLLNQAIHYEKPTSINGKLKTIIDILGKYETYNNDNCISLIINTIITSSDSFTDDELQKILIENSRPGGTDKSASECVDEISFEWDHSGRFNSYKELITLLMVAAESDHGPCVDLFLMKLCDKDFTFKCPGIYFCAIPDLSILPEHLSQLSKNALKLLIPKLVQYPFDKKLVRKIITRCLANHCDDDMCEFLSNYLIISLPIQSVYNIGLTQFSSTINDVNDLNQELDNMNNISMKK